MDDGELLNRGAPFLEFTDHYLHYLPRAICFAIPYVVSPKAPPFLCILRPFVTIR